MIVRQAANALEILEYFARRLRPATAAEIAGDPGGPRSSTFKLVGTLASKGYLYEPRGRGGYYPAPRWLVLAEAVTRAEPLPEKYHRLARDLMTATGETVAISAPAMAALTTYDWPGNVRELENAIERALILTDDDALIDASALFAGVLPSAAAPEQDSPIGKRGQITRDGTAADTVDLFLDHVLNERIPLDSVEAVLMDAAVKRAQGNLSEAARLLGMSRGQLAYRIKKRAE